MERAILVSLGTEMIRRYLSTEVALLLSLMLHALAFGTWQYRQVLGQLPLFHQLARLLSAYSSPVRQSNAHAPTTITFVQTPTREPEPPRTFMETDESQVTGEQPKDAKYYSDRSTVAANPVNPTDKEGETPYLEGTETRMMSTETVSPRPGAGASQAPPSAPAPAIPASPPPAPPAPPASKVKNDASIEQPKPEAQKVAMAPKEIAAPPPSLPPMPATPATPSSGSSSKREIGASKSRLVATGISRYGIAAFNVEESPFGAYDKGIIRAVQSRWYALIEQNGLYERSGQVTLHFKLMPDGTVQNDEHGHPLMKQEENTAGLVLASFCELAILQSAPFTPLPEKLRMLIGNEPREVNFTFYY
jgi:hypothetical protein